MDKNEAQRMLEALLKCQNTLDNAIFIARELENERERERTLEFLANVVGDIVEHGIAPILIEHPELSPYDK